MVRLIMESQLDSLANVEGKLNYFQLIVRFHDVSSSGFIHTFHTHNALKGSRGALHGKNKQ